MKWVLNSHLVVFKFNYMNSKAQLKKKIYIYQRYNKTIHKCDCECKALSWQNSVQTKCIGGAITKCSPYIRKRLHKFRFRASCLCLLLKNKRVCCDLNGTGKWVSWCIWCGWEIYSAVNDYEYDYEYTSQFKIKLIRNLKVNLNSKSKWNWWMQCKLIMQ